MPNSTVSGVAISALGSSFATTDGTGGTATTFHSTLVRSRATGSVALGVDVTRVGWDDARPANSVRDFGSLELAVMARSRLPSVEVDDEARSDAWERLLAP